MVVIESEEASGGIFNSDEPVVVIGKCQGMAGGFGPFFEKIIFKPSYRSIGTVKGKTFFVLNIRVIGVCRASYPLFIIVSQFRIIFRKYFPS